MRFFRQQCFVHLWIPPTSMCLSRVLPASLSSRIRLRSCPAPLSSAVSEYIDRWRDTTSSSSRRSSDPLDKQVVSVRTPDYPRTPLSGGGARGCSCGDGGGGGNCYYSCCCRWKLRMSPANACASAFGESVGETQSARKSHRPLGRFC